MGNGWNRRYILRLICEEIRLPFGFFWAKSWWFLGGIRRDSVDSLRMAS
uniref:Uncharacterized protein n=1 Tax=Arundo donax TaxID=35708 RepID=A0A0A9HV96_ARUDO